MLTLTNKDYSLNHIGNLLRTLYDYWLFHQAKNIYEQKITHFSKVIGVKPRGFVVKKLKNRWGSTTKDILKQKEFDSFRSDYKNLNEWKINN